MLKGFRDEYEVHRKKLPEYFKGGKEDGQEDGKEGGKEVREWEFAPQLVFARYDKFCERVETVRVRGLLFFVSVVKMIKLSNKNKIKVWCIFSGSLKYYIKYKIIFHLLVIANTYLCTGADGIVYRVHEAGEGGAGWNQGQGAEPAGREHL